MIKQKDIDALRVEPGKKIQLKDLATEWHKRKKIDGNGTENLKEKVNELLQQNLTDLTKAQQLLYADDRYSLLLVFQAMDAAGKDGTIKHVMSGVNPQGCQVTSFKKPSVEDVDHNFLWRYTKCLPERGRIGIFNRSYYEDVLVVKVHPELLQNLPEGKRNKAFWQHRYEDINAFEQHLHRNGTIILKFFLNVSKQEQKKRFLERIDKPEKNWKFSAADLTEREYWQDYMAVYEDAINATSTKWAPWYIVPADNKWVTRALVAEIVTATLKSLDLSFPKLNATQAELLVKARKVLEAEA
ncbi:MAG: polyphosphate kinase 2 family protein [Methylococcales bacterium]|nr:polyphosphate kinase 2 family protein [Methylococcales bacterium]